MLGLLGKAKRFQLNYIPKRSTLFDANKWMTVFRKYLSSLLKQYKEFLLDSHIEDIINKQIKFFDNSTISFF